jgi:hypothetical protein
MRRSGNAYQAVLDGSWQPEGVPSESVIARLGICIRSDVRAFLSSMSIFYLLSLACDDSSALISSGFVERVQGVLRSGRMPWEASRERVGGVRGRRSRMFLASIVEAGKISEESNLIG